MPDAYEMTRLRAERDLTRAELTEAAALLRTRLSPSIQARRWRQRWLNSPAVPIAAAGLVAGLLLLALRHRMRA
jgi:hypothetical protein